MWFEGLISFPSMARANCPLLATRRWSCFGPRRVASRVCMADEFNSCRVSKLGRFWFQKPVPIARRSVSGICIESTGCRIEGMDSSSWVQGLPPNPNLHLMPRLRGASSRDCGTGVSSICRNHELSNHGIVPHLAGLAEAKRSMQQTSG
jgi:hypothetical protein